MLFPTCCTTATSSYSRLPALLSCIALLRRQRVHEGLELQNSFKADMMSQLLWLPVFVDSAAHGDDENIGGLPHSLWGLPKLPTTTHCLVHLTVAGVFAPSQVPLQNVL